MPQPVTYRGMSLIVPDNDTEWKEYYAHARQHRLMLRACTACGLMRYPAMHACPWCMDLGWTWQELSGKGTIHSYEVVHHAIQPGLPGLIYQTHSTLAQELQNLQLWEILRKFRGRRRLEACIRTARQVGIGLSIQSRLQQALRAEALGGVRGEFRSAACTNLFSIHMFLPATEEEIAKGYIA